MNVQELTAVLEQRYPRSLSCSWDNDGLLCSADPKKEVKRVLVSLDATRAAIDHAAAGGFDVLLTHHPMIFHPARAVTPDTLAGARTLAAIRGGVSVISLHTRLDAGEGGVNDCLARLLDLTSVRPFGPADCPTLGRIGDNPLYTQLAFCYFWPVVKLKLKLPYLQTAGEFRVNHVAVCGGAGDDLLEAAKAAGADTFVTGEMSYNRMEDAAEMGMNVLLGGHYLTEVPVCERLAALAGTIAGAETEIYGSDPVVIR